jgi:flagellar hook-basal body complex protein FliE
MAIKDIGAFNQTLTQADAKGWSRSVDNFKINTEIGVSDIQNPQEIGGEKTFGEFLRDSVAKVNNIQQEANVAMEKLASGETQNLHEVLLAVEKADIAFKTMNQVRLKVIDAYREIMKMQV